MTLGWAMALGFGIGLRHAADADHLLALGTLCPPGTSPLKAARAAAFWGLGHSASLLGVGGLVVLLGLRVPEAFEPLAELAVGAMLVTLGVLHLLGKGTKPSEASSLGQRRALAVGFVHGMAGSAGASLLAVAAQPDSHSAFAYLVLFGAGTVAGMVLLSLLLGGPLSVGKGRGGVLLGRLAAFGGVAMGVVAGVHALGHLLGG
jgi:nickel/cobalt exporter